MKMEIKLTNLQWLSKEELKALIAMSESLLESKEEEIQLEKNIIKAKEEK